MSESSLWDLKAWALLMPSPYAALDPDGEPARQDAIERWLEKVGVKLAESDKELIKRCAKDAEDAHVPLDGLPVGPPRLLHPLSAQPLKVDLQVPPLDKFEKEFLSNLPPRQPGEDVRDWYVGLWWALMSKEGKLGSVPANLRLPDHSVAAHRSLTAALAGARRPEAHRPDGGQPALLYLHVGPVQGFISAARRTHDLWIGSFTVSYLVFAAVRAVVDELGPDAIVYPDLSSLPLAERQIFKKELPFPEELLRSSIPNKFLAVVPEDQAQKVGKKAATAASCEWKKAGKGTWKLLKKAVEDQDLDWQPEKWDAQMDDHLEIDATVQPWPENRKHLDELLTSAGIDVPWWLDPKADLEQETRTGSAYGTLFDLTHRALAAHRRALMPPAGKGDCRPKCTSCGIREQMCPVEGRQAPRAYFTKLSKAVQDIKNRDEESGTRLSLQLVRGEGLCAVCMTKRFAPQAFYGAKKGGADLGIEWNDRKTRALLRFPSVSTVASAPLRFQLAEKHEGLAEVQNWLRELKPLHSKDSLDFDPPGNLLRRLGPLGPVPSLLLSMEGTWFYESAYEFDAAWRSYFPDEVPAEENENKSRLIEQLPKARQAFRAVSRATGVTASPYYAVLMLDGDSMGEWLTGRHKKTPTLQQIVTSAGETVPDKPRPLYPALHGELSRRLGRLASKLHDVVDKYLGRVVYSGGDDLLAFLPLQTALPCLAKVRETLRDPEYLGDRVTVSAGLAIAHWHDPLGRTLELAREAEKDAKAKGRDRFAIRVDKRAGETLSLVLPWEIPSQDSVSPRFDVIEQIGQLVQQQSSSDEPLPLAGTKAAYRLKQEMATLGHFEMRCTILHRLKMLLGPNAPCDFLCALLVTLDAPFFEDDLPRREFDRRARANADVLVDLLMFVRFLLREEHNLLTGDLLAGLLSGDAS